MIINAPNKSFSVTVSSSLSFLASYNNQGSIAELNGVINLTSTVSPPFDSTVQGAYAELLEFYICNTQSVNVTVTFSLLVGSDTFVIFKTTLSPNYRIQYTQYNGFQVFDDTGK